MPACLGIEALGNCNYNPLAPSSIYLSIGEAVSALGFILAVQQLLKPIYSFRLRARFASTRLLYGLMVLGAICAFVAAVLPSIPSAQILGPLSYPLIWEIFSGLVFVAAYLAVVVAVIWPIRVRENSISRFAQRAAELLSSASERDCVDFILDLRCSLPTLVKASHFIEQNRDPSAFFLFTHRRKFEQSSYASSFLRILADDKFCKILIERAPWQTAAAINCLSDKKLHSRSADGFIQELARQAILSDDGILEREVGYKGFASAPVLSESLFSDPFVVAHYDPLAGLRFDDNDADARSLNRFVHAAKSCISALIDHGDVYHRHVAWSAHSYYRSMSFGLYKIRKNRPDDHSFIHRVQIAIEENIKLARLLESKMSAYEWDDAYSQSADSFRHDLLQSLVDTVFDALTSISSEFNGYKDPFWILAFQTFGACFDKFGKEEGLTPFQQRLALKIVDKLNDNMNGFYPPISRVMLSCVGLYAGAPSDSATPAHIIRDVVYLEMKKFAALAAKQPHKVGHYLPSNMGYNKQSDELTFVYSDGRQHLVNLSNTSIAPISLADPSIRRSYDKRPSLTDD